MKFRRLLIIFLSITLTGVMSLPGYASENLPESETVYTTTKEERDAIFEKAMRDIMEDIEKENSVVRGPKYHFKTEYKPYKYKVLEGYAGNQKPGGERFETGGGFWFTDSGGPSVSASVNIGLPKPYDYFTVSINLGNRGATGKYVEVPTKEHYYKLYVEKTMEIRPYLTYRAPVGTENWELYDGGAVQVVFRVNQYARRV